MNSDFNEYAKNFQKNIFYEPNNINNIKKVEKVK